VEPALAEFVQLEPTAGIFWRAFELRPELVSPLDPQGEYLSRVWREHVYPLARMFHELLSRDRAPDCEIRNAECGLDLYLKV
jgi:hypothetical protein